MTTTARPTIRVPDTLTEHDCWIVWRTQRAGGKPTKVPYQINGNHASSTDATTWCPWDDAVNALREHPSAGPESVSFSPDDPFFGIDLDQCLDAVGNLKPWAQPIMERFADSYSEISPGRSGIKLWAKGRMPGGGVAFQLGDGRIEIYDRARYFTVTGNHWCGQMLDVEEHQSDLDWLLTLSPHGPRRCRSRWPRARSRRVPNMTAWSASPVRCAPADVSIRRSRPPYWQSIKVDSRSPHRRRTLGRSPPAFAGMHPATRAV